MTQFSVPSSETSPEDICKLFTERLVISKVYFSLAIFNTVYVISTTALLLHRARSVRKDEKLLFPVNESQVNSLSKRNLLALAVGAIGHLLVVSISIIIKAMHGCLYCPIFMYVTTYGYYLWIASFIWRAYYLRFQLTLHKIKLRIGNGETKEDREWYMHNQDQHSVSNRRFIFVLIIGMAILTIPLILMHRFYYGFNHYTPQSCSSSVGTIILLTLVTSFQCVLSPILIWLLRHDRDAHNLRNELIAICIVGIPMSILYLVWVTVLPPAYSSTTPKIRMYWGSINWIGLGQAVAHVVTVTYPLLASYGLCTCSCMRIAKRLGGKGRRKSSVSLPYMLDCSMASLEFIINEPELLEHLKQIAVQDFSTENVLFCEHYHILANKTISKLNENRLVDKKHDDIKYNTLLDDPIPCDLQSDYVAFYNTFIKEGAPLQVNIAYSDRKAMDSVFKEYARRQQHILENAVSQIQTNLDDNWGEELVPYVSATESKQDVSSVSEDRLLGQPSTNTVIRCNVFDNARKEVMWIIFYNILPKFIDDCK
ncbi:hypothetical protein BGW37DRAFT_130388 [Umbelopsis sp. PMI_123]|nr:hypothetical protein BGW37DRAFT_130388 [Umbelopsis sp. PMI_123]